MVGLLNENISISRFSILIKVAYQFLDLMHKIYPKHDSKPKVYSADLL